MIITLYGIKNCDTVKKARAWLKRRGVNYTFHDYKLVGIDAPRLKQWAQELGWDALLNRRGTTFRELPDDAKRTLDETAALQLMLEQTSLIKRPVLECNRDLVVGFKAAEYQRVLNNLRVPTSPGGAGQVGGTPRRL